VKAKGVARFFAKIDRNLKPSRAPLIEQTLSQRRKRVAQSPAAA